jgi:hypothetical protein
MNRKEPMNEAEKLLEQEFGITPLAKKLCKYRGFTACLGKACSEWTGISLSGTPPGGGKPQEVRAQVCHDDYMLVKSELIARSLDDIRRAITRMSLTSGVNMPLPKDLLRQ